MERLDQDINVAIVITNLSNIDHPRSPAGIESLLDRPKQGIARPLRRIRSQSVIR
jgi:hypothetical protein